VALEVTGATVRSRPIKREKCECNLEAAGSSLARVVKVTVLLARRTLYRK
jgi:hypothetical protein